jgi:hypothetical protein
MNRIIDRDVEARNLRQDIVQRWPPLIVRVGACVPFLLVYGSCKTPPPFGAMLELIKVGILAMLSLI